MLGASSQVPPGCPREQAPHGGAGKRREKMREVQNIVGLEIG